MLKQLKIASILFLALVLITGLVYPAVVTLFSQVIFPHQANGSQIVVGGKVVGSSLIGQQFTDPKYFWGRLSDTGALPYDASNSAGSNLGQSNPALVAAAQARLDALKAADPGNTQAVPVDLITASGSGLDPAISVAAARYQALRVARLRGMTLDQVNALIDKNTQGKMLGFLGEATVNVLELNLALDGKSS
jgi:K+-transporting ATPase ATPase C chain